MNKHWMTVLAATALFQGCATVDRSAIPVVDASSPVSEEHAQRQAVRAAPNAPATQAMAEDSGVVVMVPEGNSAPLQAIPLPQDPGGITGSIDNPPSAPANQDWNQSPAPIQGSGSQPKAPSGVPSSAAGLAADEQLDGPVLALLTTAQQQQGGGDLNGAASSLERAQRIAPREPQVLYRLAQVRLAQDDALQAEQLARRGLSYASGRPALQASLWELIAKSRESQGDAAGAAQARERAKVSL